MNLKIKIINEMIKYFRKVSNTMTDTSSQLWVKIKTTKVLEILEHIPRWVERSSRVYLIYDNLHVLRVIQNILMRCAYADVREECLRVLVQVILTFFFITHDMLTFEIIDAIFNPYLTPPSDQLIHYITASEYLNATPSQLEQLALGDISLLTDYQLECFEERYEVYERQQTALNPKSYPIRWELIIVAIVLVTGLSS